jgi:hypothetical protein
MDFGSAGIADHLPERLAGIAAVDRVGETGLDKERIDEFVEPWSKRHAVVRDLAVGNLLEKTIGIAFAQFVEALAVPLPACGIRRGDTRLEELLWREWQLIAELRLALLPGSAHVEPRAFPEAAGELPVDEGRKPAIDPVRGQRVGRTHHADHRFDEAGFVRPER